MSLVEVSWLVLVMGQVAYCSRSVGAALWISCADTPKWHSTPYSK